MNEISKRSLEAHEKSKGKLSIETKVDLKTKDDLSIYYTPGVAEPCRQIRKDPELAYKYTMKGNLVAVISDGSAVLGLGNIGPLASAPVMEGKSALLKAFADVDSIPIYLDTQDVDEMVNTIKNIAPTFGAINLEDISAPRCFEVSDRLEELLDIPVFHDDQYGTAIVCLAGLMNSLKLIGKTKEMVKIVISGAGAAGIAITKLFLRYGFENIILQDSRGLLYEGRENLNWAKEEIVKLTNKDKIKGGLFEAIEGADVFIGVSQPNVLSKKMVKTMANDAIIFAMSNPDPEIMPEDALEAGAKIVATGRSDYPNQINNVLVFPGIFRGALDSRASSINWDMKLAAANALADLVESPSAEMIIPDPFDPRVAGVVAEAVKKFA